MFRMLFIVFLSIATLLTAVGWWHQGPFTLGNLRFHHGERFECIVRYHSSLVEAWIEWGWSAPNSPGWTGNLDLWLISCSRGVQPMTFGPAHFWLT